MNIIDYENTEKTEELSFEQASFPMRESLNAEDMVAKKDNPFILPK